MWASLVDSHRPASNHPGPPFDDFMRTVQSHVLGLLRGIGLEGFTSTRPNFKACEGTKKGQLGVGLIRHSPYCRIAARRDLQLHAAPIKTTSRLD